VAARDVDREEELLHEEDVAALASVVAYRLERVLAPLHELGVQVRVEEGLAQAAGAPAESLLVTKLEQYHEAVDDVVVEHERGRGLPLDVPVDRPQA
jgi:hypothetical protein